MARRPAAANGRSPPFTALTHRVGGEAEVGGGQQGDDGGDVDERPPREARAPAESCARNRGAIGARYAIANSTDFRYGHAPAAATMTSAVTYAPPSHAFWTEYTYEMSPSAPTDRCGCGGGGAAGAGGGDGGGFGDGANGGGASGRRRVEAAAPAARPEARAATAAPAATRGGGGGDGGGGGERNEACFGAEHA